MKNPNLERSANFHEPEKDDGKDDNEYRDNRTLNIAYFHISIELELYIHFLIFHFIAVLIFQTRHSYVCAAHGPGR